MELVFTPKTCRGTYHKMLHIARYCTLGHVVYTGGTKRGTHQVVPRRIVSSPKKLSPIHSFACLALFTALSKQVTVDCRTLPGQDEAYVLDHVRRALGPAICGDTEHCSINFRFTNVFAGDRASAEYIDDCFGVDLLEDLGASVAEAPIVGRTFRLGPSGNGLFLTMADVLCREDRT